MSSTRSFSALLLLLCSTLSSQRSNAQTLVHASSGYDVNISITLVALVPHTNPCTYGYNYDVRLSYVISFSGSGAPASMYTLQGTVGCGSSSLFFDLPNGPSSGTTTTTGNAWRGVADCNTATLATLGCTDVNIQIQGPGINYQTVNIPSTTLPITLVAFDAVAKSGTVELNWITATEKDNDHFTVERSADARSFSPVLRLPGAGNSSEMLHYSAIDHAPLSGISYYRLRQTDIDGTSILSTVVVVEAQDRENTLDVFPNPSDASVIELPANTIGQYLEIRTMTGVMLYSGVLVTNSFQSPSLCAGTYLLTVADPRTGYSRQCRLVRL